tara:strand:+ start:144 stop:491 length:348 start_codon:yes stop_codon:yes gene_type:complete
LRRDQGLTILEILVFLVVAGIVATLIVPRFFQSEANSEEGYYRAEKQTVHSQLELFYFRFSRYPEAMTEPGWGLGDADGNGVSPDWQEYWPDGVPTRNVYGQVWNYDPEAGRIID